MRRLRGLKDLAHDAVGATATLVEEAHTAAAHKALWALERVPPIAGPARAVDAVRRRATRGVIGSVHGVNRAVSRLGDLGLEALGPGTPPAPVPLRSDLALRPDVAADALVGALNGVVGDHLHARGNGLAMDLQLRLGDRFVRPEEIDARRVVLLVHGLSATEWSWCLNAEAWHGDPGAHFGALLERDLGLTPVFVRYNSGRHISENGRELAALLASLRCEELMIVGHSMGGLVARSACHYAERDGHRWLDALTHVASLGSPHHGAPLEKLGNVLTAALGVVDLPATVVLRRLLEARSAGIKDLRFGYLVDEDWQGHDPDALLADRRRDLPLREGVTWAFLGATLTADPAHPVGHVLGDLLVRRPSARGPVTVRERFDVHAHELGGVMHHELQGHPEVYARLVAVLRGEIGGSG